MERGGSVVALRMVSYLAPGLPERLFAVLADHLARWVDDGVDLILDVSRSGPTPGEERIFRPGGMDLAFICSTSYVWMTRAPTPAVRLAGAAWVPVDPRSAGRPVFHADVVTGRRDIDSIADLAGRVVAYNDESSLSGLVSIRLALREAGVPESQVLLVRSGSHAASAGWVRDGEVDAAAIDATVLRRLRRRDPSLDRLRTVTTLGPFPSQPLVVREGLGPGLLARVRVALLRASADPEVAAALREAELLGFAPIADRSFDPLRQGMAALDQRAAPA